jgi:hypothetical protein
MAVWADSCRIEWRIIVGLLDRFVRGPARLDDSLRIWEVQFEPGGRVYTYCRTRTALQAEMRDRIAARKGGPHRIEATINGKAVEVNLEDWSERR